jgi:hypothetical protein
MDRSGSKSDSEMTVRRGLGRMGGFSQMKPRPRATMTTNGITALVLTDPQNDFLSENGVAWELVGRNVQGNGTVDNIERLLHSAKTGGTPCSCLRTITTPPTTAGSSEPPK